MCLLVAVWAASAGAAPAFTPRVPPRFIVLTDKKGIPRLLPPYSQLPKERQPEPSPEAPPLITWDNDFDPSFLANFTKILTRPTNVTALLNLSSRNYPPALHYLGELYELGVRPVERNLSQALEYFCAAADRGYPESLSMLASYYRYGFSSPSDETLSIVYDNLAAVSPSVRGLLANATGHYLKGNVSVAAAILKTVAHAVWQRGKGSANAPSIMRRFNGSMKFEAATKTPLRYVHNRQGPGNEETEILLGRAYYHGTIGMKPKYARVAQLLERHMDDPRAIRYLSAMRFHGAGVPRDGERAISLIREHCRDAGLRLSDLISLDPASQLLEAGIEHLEMAAEQGDPEAVFRYLKQSRVSGPADARRVYEGMKRLAKDGFYEGCLHVGLSLAAEKPARAAKWLWKVVQAGPWNEVGRLAESAFTAEQYDVALRLWLELADMGIEVGAFNAGFVLAQWDRTGAGPPFGWGEQTRLKLATRMLRRSYRLGFEPASELVIQSYLARGRKDKTEKWMKRLQTPKIKDAPTDDL